MWAGLTGGAVEAFAEQQLMEPLPLPLRFLLPLHLCLRPPVRMEGGVGVDRSRAAVGGAARPPLQLVVECPRCTS